MKNFLFISTLSSLLLAGNLSAQKPSDYVGLWELGGKQRKYAAALILRQEGNRYPNFLSGARTDGKLSIESKPDLLGDSFTLESNGGIQCVFNRMAPKPGMEQIIPGGVWGTTLGEQPLEVSITGFTGWEMVKDSKSPTLTAKTTGFVKVGSKQTKLEGVTTFRFDEDTPKWNLSSKCFFTGKSLGLPENQHGPIQLQLYTNSPVSKQTPNFPSTELKF